MLLIWPTPIPYQPFPPYRNVVVHTHRRFLYNIYPYTPFSPVFVIIFTFLGLFAPQLVHFLPVPNMEWAVYEFCVVPALGTRKKVRVR